MTRIFLTLAIVTNVLLAATWLLGWRIEDPRSLDPGMTNAVTLHMLTALGTALLVLLAHAIALTYFMGTGRWLEETCTAYSLGPAARDRNIKLKYRVIPGMVACLVAVLATGAFGALSDPAANVRAASAAGVHFALGSGTVLLNMFVSAYEVLCIRRNGQLVAQVIERVHTIRADRGLPV